MAREELPKVLVKWYDYTKWVLERGGPIGLPIGNLTSQFFANVYLDGFDHFAKQKLQARGYVRYVDDFLIFGESRAGVRERGEAARGKHAHE